MGTERALMVEVITTVRDNPNKIHDQRRINYSSALARRWLANHCIWAFHNGYAVHTAAA